MYFGVTSISKTTTTATRTNSHTPVTTVKEAFAYCINSMIDHTIVIGATNAVFKNVSHARWTFCISFVVLVIKDSVEKEAKSAIANLLTLSYNFCLRSVTVLPAAALDTNRIMTSTAAIKIAHIIIYRPYHQISATPFCLLACTAPVSRLI